MSILCQYFFTIQVVNKIFLPACSFNSVFLMIFDLIQIEFKIMSVNSLNRKVCRVRQKIIVWSHRFNNNMESWGHFRRHHHAEGCNH